MASGVKHYTLPHKSRQRKAFVSLVPEDGHCGFFIASFVYRKDAVGGKLLQFFVPEN